MRKYLAVTVAALALTLAVPAIAQNQQPAGTPVLLRGTIDGVDGNRLTITTREGKKIDLTMNDALRVGYNTQKTLADLDEGVQVGVTTVDGPDGKPRALEVHVMDDAGNVHRPWDLAPNSTMTNGIVTNAEDASAGAREITVHYKTPDAEGDWVVTVPPDTPVVYLLNDGDRSLLVPGAYVFVSARKLDDGTYTTGYIQAEKEGVKPPL